MSDVKNTPRLRQSSRARGLVRQNETGSMPLDTSLSMHLKRCSIGQRVSATLSSFAKSDRNPAPANKRYLIGELKRIDRDWLEQTDPDRPSTDNALEHILATQIIEPADSVLRGANAYALPGVCRR